MSTGPVAEPMTYAEAQGIFRRAMRTVAILAVVLAAILTVTAGWQTALLLLLGALISWSGIREWWNVTTVVFDRMTPGASAKPVGRTLVMFFLRLGIAALILYGSLRCLHGSIYAMVAGLGLAVVALSVEALRLLRG